VRSGQRGHTQPCAQTDTTESPSHGGCRSLTASFARSPLRPQFEGDGGCCSHLVELGGDAGAEKPPSTPRADSPRLYILRVAPHQICSGVPRTRPVKTPALKT